MTCILQSYRNLYHTFFFRFSFLQVHSLQSWTILATDILKNSIGIIYACISLGRTNRKASLVLPEEGTFLSIPSLFLNFQSNWYCSGKTVTSYCNNWRERMTPLLPLKGEYIPFISLSLFSINHKDTGVSLSIFDILPKVILAFHLHLLNYLSA